MRRVMVLLLLVVGAGLILVMRVAASQPEYTPAPDWMGMPVRAGLPGVVSADSAAFLSSRQIPSSQVEQPPHFPQRCLKCHAAQGDCALCHAQDLPTGDHPELFTCASCHERPAEAGQGSLAWRSVRIDHSSPQFSDCQSCHSAAAPAGHYQAQCSSCHTPPLAGSQSGWSGVVLDHAAAALTDCQSCHAQTRPASHFSGQCSACHNTSAWRGAAFSHQGATNCQNCHNPPRSHYGNNCQQCHTPGKAWANVSLRWHRFDMDHGGANGNCSTCHTRNGMNCTSCHESEEGDDDHGGDDDD